MKTLFSFIVALMILYMGRDNETQVSILDAPSNPPLSKAGALEIKYQHVRLVGEEIEVTAHDVWETEVLWLRLPVRFQVGDTISLDNQHFQYEKYQPYRLIESFVVITGYEKEGEFYRLETRLHYCVANENNILCVSEIPLQIVY